MIVQVTRSSNITIMAVLSMNAEHMWVGCGSIFQGGKVWPGRLGVYKTLLQFRPIIPEKQYIQWLGGKEF